MTRRVALTVCAALVIAGPAVWAHEGHDHKVMGTITMAAADHVMLKDTTDKDVTVYVDANTKVTRDKKPMRIDDVKNGMRVVITATTVTDNNIAKLVAKAIELGAAPPSR